jgi:hypothetical protein
MLYNIFDSLIAAYLFKTSSITKIVYKVVFFIIFMLLVTLYTNYLIS